MQPLETVLTEMIVLLERRFGVDALVVFGSEAKGIARPDSDVDLAALFRSPPGDVALREACAELERIARRPVDLVDLERASPILAFQVLRDGRCVHGADSPRLAAFRAILPGRYEDLKRVRAAAEAALVERVVHGGS
jgi:predicted nucleotidyltransferase